MADHLTEEQTAEFREVEIILSWSQILLLSYLTHYYHCHIIYLFIWYYIFYLNKFTVTVRLLRFLTKTGMEPSAPKNSEQ